MANASGKSCISNGMKAFLLLSSLFIGTVKVSAQVDNSDTVWIRIGCGAAGVTDNEFYAFKPLVKHRDLASIRKKLLAGNRLEQVLSLVVLRDASIKPSIKFSQQEQVVVDALQTSTHHFYLCFTCTVSEEGNLKQLFAGEKSRTYELIRSKLFDRF